MKQNELIDKLGQNIDRFVVERNDDGTKLDNKKIAKLYFNCDT